ncbi:hypothetical protein GCM10010919_29650 [Alishewanella longhuensis]|uniref:Uncharacterized protein n=1 Tax=Alishewanella longhuensis TaxID=1091037 RepID=A0ABQ3L216_9ALTE|nr:hypothetical protein [Alishewanella longhuensis]GHG75453.1 hypothetical protein GCM10010919_29650 [Alishewanella longhuensis]
MIRWILAALILLPALAYYVSNFISVTGTEPTPVAQNTLLLADDGPYAFFDETETQLTVKWLCAQQVIEQQQTVAEVIVPRCAYNKPIAVRPTNQVAVPSRAEASSLAVLSDIPVNRCRSAL